jgi:hypothetical protein
MSVKQGVTYVEKETEGGVNLKQLEPVVASLEDDVSSTAQLWFLHRPSQAVVRCRPRLISWHQVWHLNLLAHQVRLTLGPSLDQPNIIPELT